MKQQNTDTVITGARTSAASTVNADDLRRPTPRIAFADEPKAEFPTRFQSITQFRVVTLNVRTRNNDNSMKDNKFNVVFESGYLDITRKPYPFDPETVSRHLRASDNYGIGKDFWDADEFAEVSKQSALDAFVSQAKQFAKTEEGRSALKAVLGDRFNLPPISDDPQPASPNAE